MNKPQISKGANINLIKSREKLKNPKQTLKRILKYLGSKKLSIISVLVFCTFTTLITIFGTKLNGEIVDKYISKGNIKGLFNICIVLIGMYILATISTFIQNRLMISIAQNTTADIRSDLYKSMQKLPISYFDTHSSGDLMSRLINDVDKINMTLSQSVTQIISGIINVVGMLIAMLLLSPKLTAVGLLGTPVMFICTRLIMKHTQPFFIKRQKETGALVGYVEEMISGQKAVSLFSQEENVRAQFSKLNKKVTRSSIIAEGLSGCMGPVMNFVGNLTYLILAVSGGYLIVKGEAITVGVVFTIILYMRNFNQPINQILNISNTIQGALAGAERVFEVMDEKEETDLEKAKDIENIAGSVALKDVEFSYNKDKQILNKISLTANPGETIAIVGPTGSGKTTIINLLNKFYNIDSGEITIDNKNIDNISMKSLRKNVAIVLQDTYLFSVSVRENLRYGRLDASDEEIIKASKLANAHHFIKQLPNGYDTVLNDNGGNLSQGQRQLLAIARAILSNASILILDEATSSIDTLTEVMIQNAMINLMKGKTTFIIAHRLSTIRNANKIIALKDGKIIESGTHDELLREDGFYANLYNSQFRSGLSI